MTSRNRLIGLAAVVAYVLLVLAVCTIPYHIALPQFMKGASFQAGYNNSAAFLVYWSLIWLPALLVALLLPSPSPPPKIDQLPSQSTSIALVAAVLAAHAALFLLLFLVRGRFFFAEAIYFQAILHRMSTGEVPYVDFSFYYGPAMLYPARWASRLLGLENGYALTFVSTYLLGLLLLRFALRLVIPDRADRWFPAISLLLFNPWTGLNVTLVRYVLPVLVVFWVWGFVRSGGTRSGVAACVGLSFAVLYSFDAAAVAITGSLVAASSLILRSILSMDRENNQVRSFLARFGLVFLAAGASTIAAFHAVDPSLRALVQYPAIALSYASGAHNYPITAALPFLTMSAATVLVLGAILRLLWEKQFDGRWDLAAVMVAVVAVSQRGAFGVSEPTHFAYYALPVTLVCAWSLPHVIPTVRPGFVLLGLTLGTCIPLQYLHATLAEPAFQGSRQRQVSQNEPRESRRIEESLLLLVQDTGRDERYFMYKLDYYSVPVYSRLGLFYAGTFTHLGEARSRADIQLEICDLFQQRAIVLAKASDLVLSDDSYSHHTGLRRVLDRVTGAATVGSELGALADQGERHLYAPLVESFRTQYVELTRRDGIVALRPKESAFCSR